MNDVRQEPSDGTFHRTFLWRPTASFLVDALRHYEALLAAEQDAISADPVLSKFVTDETRRETATQQQHWDPAATREFLEEKLSERPNTHSIHLTIPHGLVRHIKSAALLYLGKIKQHRNQLSLRRNISTSSLAAVDREITKHEELLNGNTIFGDATPAALLVDQIQLNEDDIDPPASDLSLARTARPKPVLIASIQILDDELRLRCLDLFHQFQSTEQSDRNDTVVAEASRILEDRLRKALGEKPGSTALDLVNKAFGGSSPRLRIAEVDNEQAAVHALFRGFFGFIRNSVQHRLLANIPAERVLQILGMCDYLISLMNSSNPTEGDI